MSRYWCQYASLDRGVAASVLVDVHDDRIADVQVGVGCPADAVRLEGLTLPGFANSHSHAFHRALRGRTQVGSGSFWTWREQMYSVAGRVTPEQYHDLARAVYGEMAMAGITCVGEFHYLHHGPGGVPYDDVNAMGEAVVAAAEAAGVRITLLDTCYLHGGLHDGSPTAPNEIQRRFSDGTVAAWAERVEGLLALESASCRVGAAVHSVRAVDPDAVEVVARWADGRSAPLHAHVSEQPAENEQCALAYGRTPTQVLAEHGAITDRFTAVHATHLTAPDIEVLGDAGCTICMCPTTERDLADGIGQAAALRAAGARLTLGSDSHAVIDMFEEARAVELDERLATRTRGHHDARSLLAAATFDGHASLGWDDAGRIRSGDLADLVTVSLGSVRTAGRGVDSLLETAVFAASAADVRHVVASGRVVVDHGHHTRFDVAAELDRIVGELWDV
jgi:formiminoglutamate deiminase